MAAVDPRDEGAGAALERLAAVVAALRGEGGCPWDREQTHLSLRAALIEEAHEVVEAIEADDTGSLLEELGDVLLQVVFHSQLAKEAGEFNFRDVAEAVRAKLIRRHPHVFPGGETGLPWDPEGKMDGAKVTENWEEIKKREKERADKPADSVLDGVSRSLPALVWTQKLQERASRVGFDWEGPEGVLAKVREELEEVEEVYAFGKPVKIEMEEEVGDLLFTVVNLARSLGLSAEVALGGSGNKFRSRFRMMEKMAGAAGRQLKGLSAEEWEEFWEKSKEIKGMNKESGDT